MFEGLVEPVAVVLRSDPAGAPETEDKGYLGENYGVRRRLRPVSCLWYNWLICWLLGKENLPSVEDYVAVSRCQASLASS